MTDSRPLRRVSASDLHLELIARATSCPGAAIRDWVLDNRSQVAAAMSGSIPGHTLATTKDSGPLRMGRHPDGLRPMRALARGEWAPSHVWLLGKSAKAARAIERAASDFHPKEIRLRDPEGTLRPEHLVELLFDAPSPPSGAATAALAASTAPTLADASPLDIHLELIRRTRFNDFNGPRIFADLLEHRDLWHAVTFGRDKTFFGGPKGVLPYVGAYWNTLTLLPIEKLEGYNADTIWALVPNREAGRELLAIARGRWRSDARKLWNRKSSRVTARCPPDERIVSFWWD